MLAVNSRWLMTSFLGFVAFTTIVLSAVNVFAGPGRTTYQAKIMKPDGYPLEASSVNFKFTILDPGGTCILYSETYSAVNMNSTGGLVSFSLGSGVKTYPVSSPTFEDVFSNITPFMSCDAGGPPSYSPNSSDIRKIVMQFHDGNGWQTLPAMNINAVPYAMYATHAEFVGGVSATSFVRDSEIPVCSGGQALSFNGTMFSCITASSGGVSYAAVTTALGYTPADSASFTTAVSELAALTTFTSNVSSTVFSVSAAVSTLAANTAASFSTITSSQWISSGTGIYYPGNASVNSSNMLGTLGVGDGLSNTQTVTLNAGNFAWYGWYLGGQRTAFIESSASAYTIYSQTLGVPMIFSTSASERMRISASGSIGIASATPGARLVVKGSGITSSTLSFMVTGSSNASNFVIRDDGLVGVGNHFPVTKLDVGGGIRVSMESASCGASFAGTIRYNTGNLEFCNGTSWSALGVAGAGITSLNSSTSNTQTFATGIAGTAFNVSTNNGVHSFNIPLAASASVMAGLLSNADYMTFTNKLSSTSGAVISALGYTPANTTSVTSLVSNLNSVSSAVSSLQSSAIASFSALSNSYWSLSGNAGTSATTNFIGTTDDHDLVFRRNNISAGLIGHSNTAFGLQAGFANGLTNVIVLGQQAYATQSHQAVFGNGLITQNNFSGKIYTAVTDSGSGVQVVNLTSTSPRYPAIDVSNFHNGTGGHPVLSMSNSGGQASAPTALLQNHTVGTVLFNGQVTASQTMQAARIDVLADGNFGVNTAPSRMLFSTAGPTGLYQARMTINSLGFIGAGQLSPTGLLHIGATTSSTAGLKLTAGPLLNSPQSGTIEYDGTSLYFTDSTNTRRTIATSSSVQSFTSASYSGSVAASGSLISNSFIAAPTIYGSSAPNGQLTIDATSSATKGHLILNPSGGFVGVGTSSPIGALHVVINNASTVQSGVTDAFVLQNKNTTPNALTSMMFANQDGFATAQISGLQNTGNAGSALTLATKTSGGGWNTSQLVLNTNNRVGIGTATPSSRLEVTPANDTSTAFYVGDSTSTGVTGLYFSRWGSASAPMGIQGTVAGVGANTLVLQGQSGNVGIGTASATEKLTVYDGSVNIPYVANKTHGYSLDTGNNKAYIWRNYQYADDSVFFSQNWYANDAGTDVIPNAVHSTQAIEMRRNTGIMLKTGTSNTVPTARLTIDPSGNVGIGTTAPGSRFHITSPAVAGNNNRLVTGNSNSDLMDATSLNGGEVYLDHIVSARLTATASTTIVRAATLKIDTAPTATSGATITNPYALWVQSGNSVFGGNLGIGVVSSPSSYGHGGTNKFIEIHNPGTTIHSQSHLILTTAVSDITATSIGSLTWAQPNVSTSRKEVAWIGAISESASGAAPAAYFQVNTRSSTDALPQERMRVTGSGNVGIGSTSPGAFLHVSKNLGGSGNGVSVMRVDVQNTADNNYSMLELNHGSNPLVHVRGDGYIGLGVSQPATMFSNTSVTANNANSGDSNGTGQSGRSLTWSTSAVGYAAAITNAANSAAANGLQVRTTNTATNTTVLAVGTGVSSTANTSDIFVVKANGRVGVNTTSPNQGFAVNGMMALQPNSADHVYMELYARTAAPTTRSAWIGYGGAGTSLLSMTNEISNGHINFVTAGTGKIGINTPSPSYMLDVNGTIRGYGITDSSDVRLKKNIKSLDQSLEKILQVQGVSYDWKDQNISERKQIGFIAQQLEKIFPELVETDNQGMKSVNYSHLVSPLVEAVKSLYGHLLNIDARVQSQAREIATIKAENQDLKQKVKEFDAMKAYLCEKDPKASICQ